MLTNRKGRVRATGGAAMASRSITAGREEFLGSGTGVPSGLTEAGGAACATPFEVARRRRAEEILLMNPDTPHVEAVRLGKGGVAENLSAGKGMVGMSHVSPRATKAFAEKIGESGRDHVDVREPSGEVGARAATLTNLCGARNEASARVPPLLQLMGMTINCFSGVSDGQTCTAANRMIVALNIEAFTAAVLFASKAGANPAWMQGATTDGFASSRFPEINCNRMIARTVDPGFRIAPYRNVPSLALAIEKALADNLPDAAEKAELFSANMTNGRAASGAARDCSAMVGEPETMATHTVAGDLS